MSAAETRPLPDHIVLKCSNPACGLRYPSPADDPRVASCPLCEAPTAQVAHHQQAPVGLLTPPSVTGSLIGVLDNIRSAHNVGTMFRSADGAQLQGLHLCGLTAGADHRKVIKTALGAEQTVSSASYFDAQHSIDELRAQGYEIWALELTDRSEPLREVRTVPAKLAFIVGNERAGVDPLLLDAATRHLHLDMGGHKTSLNVAVAFGVAAYWLRTLPIS